MEKLRKTAELLEELEILRKDHTIVFTNGCFDILHAGHVHLLREAKKFGDMLVVGVNTDHSVKLNKGDDRPIISQDDRAQVIADIEHVDYVILFDDKTPETLIRTLTPDVLVKGKDWATDKVVGKHLVESLGGRVERVELLQGMSSSNIIERIRSVGTDKNTDKELD